MRVLIVGAAGRGVQDFNRVFRGRSDVDVVAGTPHDLSRQVDVDVPIVRVRYRIEPHDISFDGLVDRYADELGL